MKFVMRESFNYTRAILTLESYINDLRARSIPVYDEDKFESSLQPIVPCGPDISFGPPRYNALSGSSQSRVGIGETPTTDTAADDLGNAVNEDIDTDTLRKLSRRRTARWSRVQQEIVHAAGPAPRHQVARARGSRARAAQTIGLIRMRLPQQTPAFKDENEVDQN
ncbi:hypothetical protein K461DRAFT_278276 [Myriangium duriaei CBS 260.36]|uniref:Uncharacterized protein n=1 Tax=Myriangium duriaei CBS 260.36 TaxID=1168546 RepID=A0A9P4J6U4_9PEZI|nr:hypothetical protein K461DRAFT_278276 [Myriangium duriaei CBS 260.36]